MCQHRVSNISTNDKHVSARHSGNRPAEAAPLPEPLPEPCLPEDFARLHLPDALAKAIIELGFSAGTPVQNQVLPYSLDGRDIIAQAQTGTGKTAAFLISIIAYDLENPELEVRPPGTPYALIIAPTRELVMQITSDAQQLAQYTDLRIRSIIGGIDYEKQQQEMARGIDIIVATPGRLLDFARSRKVHLSQVEVLIIDEADRMLSMGFIPDVKSIVSRMPKKHRRQTQLFGATYREDIKRLAASWTIDPVRIAIEPEKVAVSSVTQKVYLTSEAEKYGVLYNLIRYYELERVIIFVNRRDEAHHLESMLRRHHFRTGLLAGDIPQQKRIRTLARFKAGDIGLLVATDVAGRGLHIDDISHIVNYKLPEDPEDYVHRIGRTGRAGALGISISLVCENDAFMLPNIETLLGESLQCEHPPMEMMAPVPALPPAPSSSPGKHRRRR